jgi:replicative DNA helicase
MSDTADRVGDSVLGTLLKYYKPELVTIVQARGVTPKDFWRDRQRVLYRAVLALHAQGKHVDPLTVTAFLEQHDCLTRAGGRAYLELLELSAVPSALKDHAFLVAESGRWDRLLRACESVSRAVEARDDGALREAEASLRRDVVPEGEHPKLHVVKGKEAA